MTKRRVSLSLIHTDSFQSRGLNGNPFVINHLKFPLILMTLGISLMSLHTVIPYECENNANEDVEKCPCLTRAKQFNLHFIPGHMLDNERTSGLKVTRNWKIKM